MSSSLPGDRELPASQFDLNSYWGRVRQSMQITDPRTLLTTPAQLEQAKHLLTQYKTHRLPSMTPELWRAKKIIDSTLHPDTGQPVLLPFRMSSFVLSNLVVTAGMLTPNLTTRGTLTWQFLNQSLNVAINASNANKSSPLSYRDLGASYAMAVSASCGVAVGLNALVPRLRVYKGTRVVLGRLVPFVAVASAGVVNCFLMRAGELRTGIDVYAIHSSASKSEAEAADRGATLGKSKHAAWIAVSETAASRVLNATPIMVLPPLVLIALQRRSAWLQARPRMVLPVNLGLIFATSVFALPLALGVFPTREVVGIGRLEEGVRVEWGRREGGGKGKGEEGRVWFNRGI